MRTAQLPAPSPASRRFSRGRRDREQASNIPGAANKYARESLAVLLQTSPNPACTIAVHKSQPVPEKKIGRRNKPNTASVRRVIDSCKSHRFGDEQMGARRRGRPRVLFYYGDLGLRNSARAGGPRSLTMQHATRNTIIMVGTPNTLVRQTVLVAGVTLAMCAVFATGFAAGRSFVPAEDDVELGRRLSWFGVGSAVETNAIPIGIYPIMRDFSCDVTMNTC